MIPKRNATGENHQLPLSSFYVLGIQSYQDHCMD